MKKLLKTLSKEAKSAIDNEQGQPPNFIRSWIWWRSILNRKQKVIYSFIFLPALVGIISAFYALITFMPKIITETEESSIIAKTASISPSKGEQKNNTINQELTKFFDKMSSNIRSRNWDEVYNAYHPDFKKNKDSRGYDRQAELSFIKGVVNIGFKFDSIKEKKDDGSLLVNVSVNMAGDIKHEAYRVIKRGESWQIIEVVIY